MIYLQMAAGLLAGICVCAPLVIELVAQVKNAIEARNWAPLMKIVAEMMAEAEKLYTDGASRKEYVMAQAEAAARLVNYPWDDDAKSKVSDMIDALCAMAHVVNVKPAKKKAEAAK